MLLWVLSNVRVGCGLCVGGWGVEAGKARDPSLKNERAMMMSRRGGLKGDKPRTLSSR